MSNQQKSGNALSNNLKRFVFSPEKDLDFLQLKVD